MCVLFYVPFDVVILPVVWCLVVVGLNASIRWRSERRSERRSLKEMEG